MFPSVAKLKILQQRLFAAELLVPGNEIKSLVDCFFSEIDVLVICHSRITL